MIMMMMMMIMMIVTCIMFMKQILHYSQDDVIVGCGIESGTIIEILDHHW